MTVTQTRNCIRAVGIFGYEQKNVSHFANTLFDRPVCSEKASEDTNSGTIQVYLDESRDTMYLIAIATDQSLSTSEIAANKLLLFLFATCSSVFYLNT